MNFKHGHRRKGHTSPEYRTWMHMFNRCNNPNDIRWARYGGRGITVCDRWKSFENFLADMGPKPTGRTLREFSIERVNNEGNYEPNNCKWASAAEQARNHTPQTHCKRGHPLNDGNVRPYHGHRRCLPCMKITRHERYITTGK